MDLILLQRQKDSALFPFIHFPCYLSCLSVVCLKNDQYFTIFVDTQLDKEEALRFLECIQIKQGLVSSKKEGTVHM